MTPVLVKLLSETDVSSYMPPDGYVVLFLQKSDKGLVFKCKQADGSIVTIATGSGEVSNDASVTEDVLQIDASLEDAKDGTLLVTDVEVRDGILELK
jgi:hypothetical protein